MNTQEFKRKLTAVFSADVAGYSRLMGEDEAATVKTLESYKQIMTSLIKQHRGRVIDSPGDNLLAEFASVVDAVQCGVAVQKELQARNAELPENRKMQFRIGINLGDVIEEKDRIYGDGVNIAARLEGLAEPGGLCVSGTAFDHVKNKLSVGYQYLGKQTVKNIPDPVRAYKVLMEPEAAGKVIGDEEPKGRRWGWKAVAAVAGLVLVAGGLVWNFYWRVPKIEPASKEKMVFPLPDKPSIAVLPFVNMSGDPKQEFFSDGLTEEIITALSRVPEVFVIARNSTFTYKGKPVKVQKVAEELGVRYVLEGSLQRSGDRIRVTAQLVDALKGHPIMSDRLERGMKEIFALQDDLTKSIIAAVQAKLTEGDGARLRAKSTASIEAYLMFLEARELLSRFTKDENALARRKLEEVIALDPGYPSAYGLLSNVYVMDMVYGVSPRESMQKAVEAARKAVALDDSNASGHLNLGFVYSWRKEHGKAIAENERAVELEPGAAGTWFSLGRALDYACRHEEAIELFKKAIRMNPLGNTIYYFHLGNAYFNVGKYEEGISAHKKALEFSPTNFAAHRGLAACYAQLGRNEEAAFHAQEVLKYSPKFSLAEYVQQAPWKDNSLTERWANALRNAGLPDKPPLPLPEKPSIAVLPFVNMSDDPQQEYFSDGMTEDLITDLSKISGLFVIARNSTFMYKGKSVNVQQISRELGVKYVLEGSVRRAGDQMRINAQLLDATTGQHLWAERYDGSMRDVFSLQDRINQKIVAALAVKLTATEKTLLSEKGTSDPAAYEEFMKGREHYLKNTKDDYAKAEACFKKAIELDPKFARAQAALALLYFDGASQGPRMREAFKISYGETRLRSRQYLKDAMKDPTSVAYQVAGLMDLSLRIHGEAISQLEKALALDPNDPTCHGAMSWVLSISGRPSEGMEYAKSGMRLDPLNPARYLARIGFAHFCMGEWQDAITAIEKALKLNPELLLFGPILASAYANLGRNEEAKAAFEAYLSRLRVQFGMYYWPFKDQRIENFFAEGLIKAGYSPGRLVSLHVTKEDQLTGEDLKAFYFPSKTTGYDPWGGLDWSLEITREGAVTRRHPMLPGGVDTGRTWLEGDKLWLQFQKHNFGIAYCSTTFRNPRGTPEGENEYIRFDDVWSSPFRRVR